MENYPHLSAALAKSLEQWRLKQRLSKAALADLAGVQRNYLNEVLTEKKKPTLNFIFLLCKALHVHPVTFITSVTDEMSRMREASRSEKSPEELANAFFPARHL